VGITYPWSFATQRAALWAFLLSFHAHIFLLWVRFAFHFTTSLGKLVPRGGLRAHPTPRARS
jgi:hypothetical protein